MLFPCATSKTNIAYNLVRVVFIAALLSLPQAVYWNDLGSTYGTPLMRAQ